MAEALVGAAKKATVPRAFKQTTKTNVTVTCSNRDKAHPTLPFKFTATSPLHRLSDYPLCLIVNKTILVTTHHVWHARALLLGPRRSSRPSLLSRDCGD